MGDADRVLDQTAGPQKRGETRVHAEEGDFIHDGHQGGESLREQVKDEFAPEIVALDPIAKCGGRDDDGLGLLFDGGDGGEGDLVEDGVPSARKGESAFILQDRLSFCQPRDTKRNNGNCFQPIDGAECIQR